MIAPPKHISENDLLLFRVQSERKQRDYEARRAHWRTLNNLPNTMIGKRERKESGDVFDG
jgi:hypothetical protein